MRARLWEAGVPGRKRRLVKVVWVRRSAGGENGSRTPQCRRPPLTGVSYTRYPQSGNPTSPPPSRWGVLPPIFGPKSDIGRSRSAGRPEVGRVMFAMRLHRFLTALARHPPATSTALPVHTLTSRSLGPGTNDSDWRAKHGDGGASRASNPQPRRLARVKTPRSAPRPQPRVERFSGARSRPYGARAGAAGPINGTTAVRNDGPK